jgi:hypothetical protein
MTLLGNDTKYGSASVFSYFAVRAECSLIATVEGEFRKRREDEKYGEAENRCGGEESKIEL